MASSRHEATSVRPRTKTRTSVLAKDKNKMFGCLERDTMVQHTDGPVAVENTAARDPLPNLMSHRLHCLDVTPCMDLMCNIDMTLAMLSHGCRPVSHMTPSAATSGCWIHCILTHDVLCFADGMAYCCEGSVIIVMDII